MYSDPLYLLLAVGAFLCLERDRVVAATCLGALATAARPVAPALVLGLVLRRLEWRRERGERPGFGDALPVLAVSGFAAYALYLGRAFGDPLAFVHVQSAPGWDQAPGAHTWLKITLFEVLLHHPSQGMVARLLVHAGVTFGLLALVPATWKHVSPAYAVYLLLVVGMPALASKDLMGMGRYGLAAFPVFLTLSKLLGPHPRLYRAWRWGSALLLLLLAGGFGATRYIS
jgi:hypothetical protein